MRSQINHFKLYILYKMRRKLEKSRKCAICNNDVHRCVRSNAKGRTSLKHFENENQNELILPNWLLPKSIS